MADKSVEDHLDSWGLSKYKEKFNEEGITLDALFVLSKEHIGALVSTIGDRALLEAHIQGLKDAISNKEVTLESYELPVAENIQDISFTNLLGDVDFLTVGSSGTSQNTVSTPKQLQKIITEQPSVEENALRKYLVSLNEGKALLLQYEESGLLDNSADIATVDINDVKMILPQPSFTGTKRQQGVYKFELDFSNIDLR